MKTTQPPRSFQPPGLRELLIDADKWPEGKMRIKRIDTLTQEASDQHPEFVRHPGDTSRSIEWDVMRAAWPA